MQARLKNPTRGMMPPITLRVAKWFCKSQISKSKIDAGRGATRVRSPVVVGASVADENARAAWSTCDEDAAGSK